jgi:hypothetical protein
MCLSAHLQDIPSFQADFKSDEAATSDDVIYVGIP